LTAKMNLLEAYQPVPSSPTHLEIDDGKLWRWREATLNQWSASTARRVAVVLMFVPVVAALSAAVGAAGAAVAGHRQRSGSSTHVERDAAAATIELLQASATFRGRCGVPENNTDFVLSPEDQQKFGMSFDHIPSPEMCCAMCHGVPECQAWTWVKDAGLDGCPSQCWLKGGPPMRRVKKSGIVSGLPPPRPPLVQGKLPAPKKVTGKTGSVFCWSLMLPFGYEVELIKYQYKMGASIFGCDESAVYSNKTVSIAPALKSTFVPVDLTVKFGGDSYTALNSWIFIAIWKKVIDEGRHLAHDWIAKVDPDAVFFPQRLRPILARYAGTGYINNCKYGFHGPIEVLASKTLSVLQADYNASWDGKAPAKCVKELHFGQWGEDFFLSQCMWKVHGITRKTEANLMCEAHCDCPHFYWCQDSPERVTYHPFKRVDLYAQCMANALDGDPNGAATQGTSAS